MWLMPEDGQNDRNMWHVLTGLMKLIVVDGGM
jgi:hypothetical protein